jgi:RNA ligase (TIGR02306 family)
MENKSTHRAEVVPVSLKPHTNSDNLSIVEVFGYTVVVRTQDWLGKDKGIYICPDSIVPTDKQGFAFLKREGRDIERIKVKRLRGILSMGLLIPCPDDAQIGEDYAEQLGITRYEPEMKLITGENTSAPPIVTFKYDVDTIYRYNHLFNVGEPVYISEKIHGANARYTFSNGKMYCGSRSLWKLEYEHNLWWKVYYNTPAIKTFCEAHPDYVLYGEVYGPQVQDMPYGKSCPTFAAFDILHQGKWLNTHDFLFLCKLFEVPTVPKIAIDFPFDFDKIKEMANGPSTIEGANHCREGVVVRPMIERSDPRLGRLVLKAVGEDYYNRKEK